jgi:hypothetical protein
MNETTVKPMAIAKVKIPPILLIAFILSIPLAAQKVTIAKKITSKPLIIGLKIIPINATFSLVDPSSHEKIPPLIPLKAAPYSAKISADGKKNKIAVTIY